ncbi:hypothetical protein Btru_028373 [Bulinus truncatus]|nr:hypothetical protein Btru_028373 [Bulinus truncatus]
MCSNDATVRAAESLAAGQDNNDLLLTEVLAGDSRYKVSWLSQCRYLFWRSWINMLRDRMLTSVRIAIITILGVVLGLVYLRLKVDQKGIMSINGAIYLMIINTSFSTMYAVVNSFPLEMRVFLREYCTGLYRVDTYYLTKTLSEIPLFLIMNAIYAAITYWMIGLYASWDAFMIAVGVFLLITNVSISIGYLMSTLCGSVTVALAVAPPVLIPIMLFGGLFLNSADYPLYFKWLEYVSWFKYSNEILMVNQWRYVEHIPCSQNESTTLSQGVWSPAPTHTTTGAPTQCLYRSGRDILEYNGFSEDNMIDDVIIMVAIHLGFWILSILALFVRAKRSRE